MTGIPEYGTGRHEDYLVQQEELKAAADPVAEGDDWDDDDWDDRLPCVPDGGVHDAGFDAAGGAW